MQINQIRGELFLCPVYSDCDSKTDFRSNWKSKIQNYLHGKAQVLDFWSEYTRWSGPTFAGAPFCILWQIWNNWPCWVPQKQALTSLFRICPKIVLKCLCGPENQWLHPMYVWVLSNIWDGFSRILRLQLRPKCQLNLGYERTKINKILRIKIHMPRKGKDLKRCRILQ